MPMPFKMTLAKLNREVMLFGVVGITATIAHYLVANAVFALLGISIFWCNLVGFLCAFSVSYFGHYHLSFRSDAPHLKALPKFGFTALLGFLVNNAVLVVLVWGAGEERIWFIAIAMVFSAGTVFTVSKFWSFANHGAPKA